MKMSYEKEIAKHLKMYRRQSGMTQEDIDAALGLKEGRYGRIERAVTEITLSEAANIAMTLNVPIMALLVGDDPGVLDIRKHWPRNRVIIAELVRMLRDFEAGVEAEWVPYCQRVLEPYFRRLIAENGRVTEKNAPRPVWKHVTA